MAERPNQMWGVDATQTIRFADGRMTIFAGIDYASADRMGIHLVKRANRFEALEPIRQGDREHFGAFSKNGSVGLKIRYDHGSQFMSDDFQNELRFLGMESSPPFVREPEGNRCIERFFRTLKGRLLWVRHFQDLEEFRQALVEFRDRYNRKWLIERPGFQSPL